MKNFLLSVCLSFLVSNGLFSQSTLFDNSRVSSVYIEIPADSLAIIMKNVLSDYYYHALFIYDYGTGRDTLQNIGFRLRGNSSRYSKKKSFKISFNEYVSGRKYQDVKKINLNGQHNDPTMVREKLFYDTWHAAGMAERRTSFVKLYINQVYFGLYTNLEEMDKEWLQRVYGEKGGNLYKCTYPADLVYHGSGQQVYKNILSTSATGGRAYDLQTNETEDNYADLVELITILNLPADTAFARLISKKLNVDGFLKAFAIDVASGNWDDYMYNKNNFYLYHRGSTGQFEFIAYDADNTFGEDWLNTDWTTRNCLSWYNHSEPRPLASKILSVPEFMARYRRYLDTVARQLLKPSLIFPHIDSLKNMVTSAALSDTYRSLDYGYTASDFFNGFIGTVDSHTPYGIKPFIEKRYSALLQQLSITAVPEEVSKGLALNLYPNPVHDRLIVNISPESIDRRCSVIDMTGRELESITLLRNLDNAVIQVGDLIPGIYTLKVACKGHSLNKRFVIR